MTTNINISPYDFRARLRFPRIAREPPRNACGVSHQLLFPLESSSCTPINRWKNDIKMLINKKPELSCLILGK